MPAFMNIFLYEFLWREATVRKCKAFSNLALNSYNSLTYFAEGYKFTLSIVLWRRSGCFWLFMDYLNGNAARAAVGNERRRELE